MSKVGGEEDLPEELAGTIGNGVEISGLSQGGASGQNGYVMITVIT